MKKILFSLFAFCISIGLSAQAESADEALPDFEKMDNSAVSIVDAYTELEPQLLDDIDWLNYTPVNDRKELRAEKYRFVLMWITGSPTVSIKIDDRIMKFTGAEPWLLFAYMTGWTKYSLEHNYENDPVTCTVAGITNAVGFYKRNRDHLYRNKDMDRFSKMIDENSLESYVRTILAS